MKKINLATIVTETKLKHKTFPRGIDLIWWQLEHNINDRQINLPSWIETTHPLWLLCLNILHNLYCES